MTRLVIALVIVAVAVVVVEIARRRRTPDAPTQRRFTVPEQVDRADFPRPDAPWLVAVFTSDTCDKCAEVWMKAELLASEDVAVANVEFVRDRAIHDRYGIDAVPTLIITNAVVDRTVAHEFDVRDRDVLAREHLGLHPHLGAPVTGVGGEDRDEPGSLRPREVLSVHLLGNGVPPLRRRVGRPPPPCHLGDGDRDEHDRECDEQPGHIARLRPAAAINRFRRSAATRSRTDRRDRRPAAAVVRRRPGSSNAR